MYFKAVAAALSLHLHKECVSDWLWSLCFALVVVVWSSYYERKSVRERESERMMGA